MEPTTCLVAVWNENRSDVNCAKYEMIAVYCENYMEGVNTLCGENRNFKHSYAGDNYCDVKD